MYKTSDTPALGALPDDALIEVENVDGEQEHIPGSVLNAAISAIKAIKAGEIFMFAGASPPVGALQCAGQILVQADYPLLYAAIGDTWNTTGGAADPGAGNFRLPPQELNGHGLFVRGKEAGSSVGDHNTQQNASHSHSINHNHTINHNHPAKTTSSNGAHTHDVPYEIKGVYDASGSNTATQSDVSPTDNFTALSAGAHTHTVDIDNYSGNSGTHTGNSGSNGGSDLRPESIVAMLCIWTGN